MTKAELIEKVSSRTGHSTSDVSDVFEAVMKEIKTGVAENQSIFLRGFGTFIPKVRKAKIAQNISKGTPVQVPEKIVPFFKASSEFKEMVKNNNLR